MKKEYGINMQFTVQVFLASPCITTLIETSLGRSGGVWILHCVAVAPAQLFCFGLS